MLNFLLALFTFTDFSTAQWLVAPRQGSYELSTQLTYFNAKGNYLEDGSSANLPNNSTFSTMQIPLQFSYDLTSALRTYAGGTVGYTESDDGTDVRSNSALSELYAGANYWLSFGSIKVAPQVEFAYPMFRPDQEGEAALVGEGAMRLRGGSWALWRLRQWTPFGYLGAEYRDEGRSTLLPYRAGVRLRLKPFYLQGEYRGSQTIMEDDDTNDRLARDFYLTRVNGGSFYYYSVNPSVSEAALEVGVQISNFVVKGGFAMTLMGSNQAEGYSGMVGLSYQPAKRAREAEPVERFDTETESYDDSLFLKDSDPTPPSSEEISTPEMKRRVRKKVRKKPKMDKLLQETERALEKGL